MSIAQKTDDLARAMGEAILSRLKQPIAGLINATSNSQSEIDLLTVEVQELKAKADSLLIDLRGTGTDPGEGSPLETRHGLLYVEGFIDHPPEFTASNDTFDSVLWFIDGKYIGALPPGKTTEDSHKQLLPMGLGTLQCLILGSSSAAPVITKKIGSTEETLNAVLEEEDVTETVFGIPITGRRYSYDITEVASYAVEVTTLDLDIDELRRRGKTLPVNFGKLIYPVAFSTGDPEIGFSVGRTGDELSGSCPAGSYPPVLAIQYKCPKDTDPAWPPEGSINPYKLTETLVAEQSIDRCDIYTLSYRSDTKRLLLIVSNNTTLYYAGESMVVRRTDTGQSWQVPYESGSNTRIVFSLTTDIPLFTKQDIGKAIPITVTFVPKTVEGQMLISPTPSEDAKGKLSWRFWNSAVKQIKDLPFPAAGIKVDYPVVIAFPTDVLPKAEGLRFNHYKIVYGSGSSSSDITDLFPGKQIKLWSERSVDIAWDLEPMGCTFSMAPGGVGGNNQIRWTDRVDEVEESSLPFPRGGVDLLRDSTIIKFPTTPVPVGIGSYAGKTFDSYGVFINGKETTLKPGGSISIQAGRVITVTVYFK